MASTTADWSLDQATREATVARLSANLVSMAFARGAVLDVADVLEKSKTAERRAYTTAQVESRTTTGVRPHAETLRAYAR
jgi:Ran GTPase-activating protein 1